MKTIIAGSRNIGNRTFLDALEKVEWLDEVTVVISGTARGVDKWGESWAEWNDKPVMRFPADWRAYGRGAGMVRNALMADHADALIAIWDGESPGTKNMIQQAKAKGLRVAVVLA